MIRAIATVVLLLLAHTTPASAQGPQPALAYFSPSRAFALSPDGKAAQTKLAALQKDKATQIDARRRTLQAQQEELARSGSLLGDTARAARTQAVQRFEVDLERFIQDAQAELMGVERDLETAFLVKLRPALEEVAKTRALGLVFNEDAGQLAWADPALDITPSVVEVIARREAAGPTR